MSMMDVTPWMLYSKLELQPGEHVPSNIELFNGPTPQNFHEDFPIHHNMVRPQQLPPPNTFMIRSIHAVYVDMMEEDKQTLRWRYILELLIGQKIYHQAPLCGLHDGIRLIEYRRKGQPQVPGYFPDDWPLVVPWQMPIRVRLIGKTFRLRWPGIGLKFMVVLNGVMARSVA